MRVVSDGVWSSGLDWWWCDLGSTGRPARESNPRNANRADASKTPEFSASLAIGYLLSRLDLVGHPIHLIAVPAPGLFDLLEGERDRQVSRVRESIEDTPRLQRIAVSRPQEDLEVDVLGVHAAGDLLDPGGQSLVDVKRPQVEQGVDVVAVGESYIGLHGHAAQVVDRPVIVRDRLFGRQHAELRGDDAVLVGYRLAVAVLHGPVPATVTLSRWHQAVRVVLRLGAAHGRQRRRLRVPVVLDRPLRLPAVAQGVAPQAVAGAAALIDLGHGVQGVGEVVAVGGHVGWHQVGDAGIVENVCQQVVERAVLGVDSVALGLAEPFALDRDGLLPGAHCSSRRTGATPWTSCPRSVSSSYISLAISRVSSSSTSRPRTRKARSAISGTLPGSDRAAFDPKILLAVVVQDLREVAQLLEADSRREMGLAVDNDDVTYAHAPHLPAVVAEFFVDATALHPVIDMFPEVLRLGIDLDLRDRRNLVGGRDRCGVDGVRVGETPNVAGNLEPFGVVLAVVRRV